MKLSEFKNVLDSLSELNFVLPDGQTVPKHYHVTEVGQVEKKFIDCGGTIRNEKLVNFQLWQANDHDHRLAPKKLIDIIKLSETALGIGNEEIEVEYQGDTIGKYGLEVKDGKLLLTAKQTNCLAEDKCGIAEKKKISLSDLQNKNSCCGPGTKC